MIGHLHFTEALPLSLYIHIPWCVRKCPYCDFNSHKAENALPERDYVDALIADLEQDLPRVWGRPVNSIFIGGGTPSLFSAAAIDRLLAGVRARLRLRPLAEITLEANPGTVEQGKFAEFYAAGINRLSIGIQSFDDDKLKALGRIHSGAEAYAAVLAARAAGFDNLNLDLMFGLPGQTLSQAVEDVDTAIELEPSHISHYQLTLEPNTLFHRYPPSLPDEDAIWDMQDGCQSRLSEQGYRNYEVSAYAKPDRRCRHNLNYWQFGDYLGIGAGAHGKLTDPAANTVVRIWKLKNPRDFLQYAGKERGIGGLNPIPTVDLPLEFMLNALRLSDGFPRELFVQCTGLPLASVEPTLQQAAERGLLSIRDEHIVPTDLGWRFLNELLQMFMPHSRPKRSSQTS